MDVYLGVDIGSVSTNLAVLNIAGEVLHTRYIRTRGRPVEAVQQGLAELQQLDDGWQVTGVGVTGSGRQIVGAIIGADCIKNEITAHAVAALHIEPKAQTIIEIGGQDSKIILLRDGVVIDFAMNTVCAAGTGSFLDQQAARLNIPIEDFSAIALASRSPVRIAGRCAVFAESDMIHKQQAGHSMPDILAGLCQALVRNYLNNVGKGKNLAGPILFQGGVAANHGMRQAFEEALGQPVIVPPYFSVMGAIGSALLAKEATIGRNSRFRGFAISQATYEPRNFVCQGCANHCEIVEVAMNGAFIGRWGDQCGKWQASDGCPGQAI